jgi:hypothetical protein
LLFWGINSRFQAERGAYCLDVPPLADSVSGESVVSCPLCVGPRHWSGGRCGGAFGVGTEAGAGRPCCRSGEIGGDCTGAPAGPAAVASFREGASVGACWGADGSGGAAGGPAAVASFRKGASAGACWGAKVGTVGAAVASFREGASAGAGWGAKVGTVGAAVASFREGASAGAWWGAAGCGGAAGGPAAVASFR